MIVVVPRMIMSLMLIMVVMMLRRDLVALVLDDLGELFAAHLLFGLGGKFGDEIDDLVLEHRRTEAGQSLRVLAIIIVNLLLLAREPAHLGDQRLLMLVLGHFDLVAVADLGHH